MKVILNKQTGTKTAIVRAIKYRMNLGTKDAVDLYNQIELGVEVNYGEFGYAILEFYDYTYVPETPELYHFEAGYSIEEIESANKWAENLGEDEKRYLSILVSLNCVGPATA